MSIRNPRLPQSRRDRPVKRSSQLSINARVDWLQELTPLETGTMGDMNWAFRQRHPSEESYAAAWMTSAGVRDGVHFFEKTCAIEGMETDRVLAPDAPQKSLATNNMAIRYIPALKTALNLSFTQPDRAFVIEDEWNTLDIVFLDDTTWWRLTWYTGA